jgi:signal transduction histidine kinase
LLLLSASAFATDKVLDIRRLDQEEISLTEYFAVLEDPGLSLTLADVQKPYVANRFKADQTPAAALNYGYTDSAYWLRLSLSNTGNHTVERMLEIAHWGLANIQFYQPDVTGSYRPVTTGAVLPFATRPYPNHYFVFPLVLPEHSSQVVYMRIKSFPTVIPAKLWTAQAFHVYERNYYLGQAWYFGMAMAIAIFNLLLFLALREAIYLHYVSFISCMALLLAAQNGLIKEFLPFDSYTWSNISVNVGASLTCATGLLFTRSMLNTRELLPRLDQLLKILTSILLLSVIAVAISFETFGKSLMLLYLASAMLMMGVGGFCAMQRQRNAYFFVAAFSLTLLGGVIFLLRTLGLLPSNAFTFNCLQIGSALEMLLLAFALADRFAVIRRKAIDDVKQVNINLEQRLQARETELAVSYEQLRVIEQRQMLSQERQRLMQDMHDGLGSSLTSALRVVEYGRMEEAEVAQMLKGCIDDLKLAIDSMEQVDADLLLLLATLRYRLGPRLERSGIALRWEVTNVPKLDWLDPKNALHILRILQEALTNIIKHTHATEIRVATKAEADYVAVTITDNGHGFAVESALKSGGKGLSNQMSRAEAIGATVKWDSGDTGTCFTLRLPLKRKPTTK